MSIRVNGKVIASNGDVKTETDNLVTTDTNQTITAEKTFTTQLPILIERDVNQQQIPTASVAGQIVLLKNKTYTKGDGSSGWVQCVRSSTGDTTSSIAVRRFLDSDSEEITNDIGVTVAPNGVSYAYTSRQTPNEAPDNAIVTKGYVDSKSGGLELLDITFAPLGIDESKNKRRYLNGQVLIQEQFPAFTAAVKARMATMANAFTTETNWQAEKTNSKLGQCGKFVVDDTAGTIRLPCVVNAQGLADLALIGGIKSESLPNITGVVGFSDARTDYISGAFTARSIGVLNSAYSGTSQQYVADFSASSSSSTYQDNAPVQQEAIQYPYCIVVNTGVDEAERPINNYQVNNVYSYGMSQYYKGIMNNNSWLKSAGQWNDGTVYTGMYQWLIEQMNAGVSGFVASTATYTDYDWVINTTDQTFRLPLKNGQEGVFADGVKGNGITIGLIDKYGTHLAFGGQGYVSGTGNGHSYTPAASPEAYGSPVGTAMGGFASSAANTTFGLTTDPTKSGMVVDKTVPSGWNLYYYVGDTLQNAQLINVARIEEKLTDMNATSRGYVVESYHNGTGWYRIYSDGWIEQGGLGPANSGNKTITLYKPYSNANYTIIQTPYSGSGAGSYSSAIKSQTNTSFVLAVESAYDDGFYWQACGY